MQYAVGIKDARAYIYSMEDHGSLAMIRNFRIFAYKRWRFIKGCKPAAISQKIVHDCRLYSHWLHQFVDSDCTWRFYE